MAITQFEDSEPVLQAQPINSKGAGFEAFAQSFAHVSDQATQQAETLENDASHTMFLQSQAQLSHLENQTKLSLAQNPAQSETIMQNTQLLADEIKKNAFVNKKDRENLNYLTDVSVDNLNFGANKQKIELAKQQAQFSTLSAFQSNVDKFSISLWSNDPKKSEIMQNAMIGSIRGQIATGIITGIQGAAMLKMMTDEIKRHEIAIQQFKSGEASAADLHSLSAFGTDSMLDTAEMPANEISTQLVSLQKQYTAAADIRSAYARGENVSMLSYRNITKPSEIASLSSYKYGAASGIGMANSAESFPVIENEVKRLDKIKQPSEEEKGRRDSLSNYLEDFKNGNGLKHVYANPLGAKAAQDYQLAVNAIDSLPFDAATKQQFKNDAHNAFLTNINHVYEAMHVPEQYRTIISPSTKEAIEINLFNDNGKINDGLNLLYNLKSDALPYLANTMSDPHRGMVVYTLGRLKGNATNEFISNLVLTQKDNIDYSALTQTKVGGLFSSPYPDAKIKAKLEGNSTLSKILLLQNSLPAINGTTANTAMIDMGIKYIKGMAVKNGDFRLSKFNTYLNDFVSNLSQAYDPVNGYNYTMDRKVIPLNNLGMSQVANNVLRYSYKTLLDQNFTSHQLEEMASINPYKVISTPTCHLVVIDSHGKKAVDKDGHVLFDKPYASYMLNDAHMKDKMPILPINQMNENNENNENNEKNEKRAK